VPLSRSCALRSEATASPIPRAGRCGRARNLGEAGSAQPGGRALDGGGNPCCPLAIQRGETLAPVAPRRPSGGCGAPTSPKAVLAAAPLRAAGGGRHSELERCADLRDRSAKITKHELRVHANDAVTEATELAVAALIRGPATRVVATIHFDYQPDC
jgi:hypothetical protein